MWLSRHLGLGPWAWLSPAGRGELLPEPAAGPRWRRLTPSSAPPSLAGGRRCGDAVPPARQQPPTGPRPGTTAGPGRVVGRTGARRQPAAPSVTPARR